MPTIRLARSEEQQSQPAWSITCLGTGATRPAFASQRALARSLSRSHPCVVARDSLRVNMVNFSPHAAQRISVPTEDAFFGWRGSAERNTVSPPAAVHPDSMQSSPATTHAAPRTRLGEASSSARCDIPATHRGADRHQCPKACRDQRPAGPRRSRGLAGADYRDRPGQRIASCTGCAGLP